MLFANEVVSEVLSRYERDNCPIKFQDFMFLRTFYMLVAEGRSLHGATDIFKKHKKLHHKLKEFRKENENIIDELQKRFII